ncbi:hypothetical protein E3T26_16265, partial [Cryobacterium sp. TMT1-21]
MKTKSLGWGVQRFFMRAVQMTAMQHGVILERVKARKVAVLTTRSRGSPDRDPPGMTGLISGLSWMEEEVNMADVLLDRPELAGLGTYEFGWSDSDAAGASARRGVS